MEIDALDRKAAYRALPLRTIAILGAWYVSCFFLMMDWRSEAYDPIHGVSVSASQNHS